MHGKAYFRGTVPCDRWRFGAARSDLNAENSPTEQVKIVLRRGLASGRPDVADIASRLRTNEQTLQRWITDHGTTFRILLVEARQELADQLLVDPSIGIDEVACLLGYQDTSSFYRAFKDWQDTTPIAGDGPLFLLPGGDAKLAIGAGIRANNFEIFRGVGDINNARPSQNSRYPFAELNLPVVGSDLGTPLVRKLNLSAALR